ncbi:hypothetical protein Dsin_005350 [Dipteronia sinensis]|uniref:NAC domain-containing protein n=1 Tax=Dipteronia sinensis TaxID=43782 RepID=A0AAE0EEJ1_9ROSI|nr:hypothetical protein Dsin_005350 [Dipteronia sinensis]
MFVARYERIVHGVGTRVMTRAHRPVASLPPVRGLITLVVHGYGPTYWALLGFFISSVRGMVCWFESAQYRPSGHFCNLLTPYCEVLNFESKGSMEKICKEDDHEMDLPPGFRFHPTDEELITHYLYKKVFDVSFSARAIGDVD